MLSEQHRILNAQALILALFVLSGAAALIYEVVWFQLLRLTIGASAISLGIILATFMGGLCLGSILYHRFVKDRTHPLSAYGFLELGIGVFGILNPLLIPLIGELYFSIGGYGYVDIILRGFLAALFLLPPTILMGATLPAISRWVAHSREGAASLGLFYTANIIGAVLGSALAGFYLLRVFDVYVASAVAVLVNVICGVIALMLMKTTPARIQETEKTTTKEPALSALSGTIRTRVLWVTGLSGLTALGAQVVWTRLMSLYFGGTVYTFSVILAVFLAGMGLGSMIGTRLARTRRPLRLLFVTQLLLLPAIWWAQFAIQDVIHTLLLFGIQPDNIVTEPDWIAKSFNDIIAAIVVLAPATVLWGISFPLALVLVAGRGQDPGRFTGQVYAANTLGAVIGALAWSMILIPQIGTRSAQQALMIVALVAVAILWIPQAIEHLKMRKGSVQLMAGLGVIVVAITLVVLLPASNNDLMALGRLQTYWKTNEYVSIREGINSTVMVSQESGKNGSTWRQLHVSGKVVASSLAQDMKIQRQLGHLPMFAHESPRSALIIGFGAGVTAGVFTRYPEIERIVIVEIEPAVPLTSSVYFKHQNYDVANDPRTEVIIDDGRHFLATTDEKFDIITTDPIHPWMKGAASLYTSEFYELVKSRLNPGGLITQWVPLYESDEHAVKSQVATFFQAFPEGSVWNSQEDALGYDLTLLGQIGPLKISDRAISMRVRDNAEARESLADVNMRGIGDMLKLYSGKRSDLSNWMADAQINRDRNLRLEYLAGTALNVQNATHIYQNMIREVVYPEDMFDITPRLEALLRAYFQRINAQVKSTQATSAPITDN